MNTLAALLLSFSSGISAAPIDSSLQRLTQATTLNAPAPVAANRTGSRRVGGYTRSGKGSRYVGGRR